MNRNMLLLLFSKKKTASASPVNLIYDSYTRADGSIGSTETAGPLGELCAVYPWTGGAIASGKAIISPALGDELLANGNMETGSPPDSWGGYNGGTPAAVADERTGGMGTQSISVTNSPDTSFGAARQAYLNTVAGQWLRLSAWQKNGSLGGFLRLLDVGANAVGLVVFCDSATWAQYLTSERAPGANCQVGLFNGNNTLNGTTNWDDVSLKPLTFLSTLSTIAPGRIAAEYSIAAIIQARTQAGLALCLNSQSAPTAGIVVYHDGTNLYVDKFTTATAWTSLINIAATYGAGLVIKAIVTIASGHVYVDVYYDGVQIGTQQDITDAAIISNTNHGIFSTYSGNTLDNFTMDWR